MYLKQETFCMTFIYQFNLLRNFYKIIVAYFVIENEVTQPALVQSSLEHKNTLLLLDHYIVTFLDIRLICIVV